MPGQKRISSHDKLNPLNILKIIIKSSKSFFVCLIFLCLVSSCYAGAGTNVKLKDGTIIIAKEKPELDKKRNIYQFVSTDGTYWELGKDVVESVDEKKSKD